MRFTLTLKTVNGTLAIALILFPLIFGCGCVNSSSADNNNSGSQPASLAPLTRIVFITTSKGCQCTMARCARGEEALKKALKKHPDAPKVERFDYAIQTEKVTPLIKKYSAMMLPIIYFLDDGENLLWKVDGDFDWTDVDRALAKFKGAKK